MHLESETLFFLPIVHPQTTEDIQNQISELQDYLVIAGCLSPVRKVGDKHIMVRNIFQVPGHSNHLNGMTCSNIYLFICFSALRMDGWIFFQQKSNIIQLCSTPYFVTGLHYKGETRHLLQTAPFKIFQYREQQVNSRKPGGGIFKRSPPVFTFNFYLIDSVGNVVECMFKINVCLLWFLWSYSRGSIHNWEDNNIYNRVQGVLCSAVCPEPSLEFLHSDPQLQDF